MAISVQCSNILSLECTSLGWNVINLSLPWKPTIVHRLTLAKTSTPQATESLLINVLNQDSVQVILGEQDFHYITF